MAFLLHITFCVLTCQIFSTEQLNAVLIGTRNGGSFAVKGQGRKVIGKAAVLAAEDTGDAAVLPQPASRETDRASTVTIPRTFFIIRMENPLQKNRLILQLASTNHKTDFTGTGRFLQEPNRQNLSNRTHLPILRRGHAKRLAKRGRKLVWIFVADLVCNFCNGAVRFGQQLLCKLQAVFLLIRIDRASVNAFETAF